MACESRGLEEIGEPARVGDRIGLVAGPVLGTAQRATYLMDISGYP